MTIDPRWDEIFRDRGWGRWPETELVRFVMKRWGSLDQAQRGGVHFLELGSGFGAQLRFLSQEGFNAIGIEASPTAVDACPSASVYLGDVTGDWAGFYVPKQDCVLDVCCLQHVLPTEIPGVIERVGAVLKPGGVFWSKWSFAVTDRPVDTPPIYGREQSRLLDLLHRHVGRTGIGQMSVTPPQGETHRHWIITAEKPA